MERESDWTIGGVNISKVIKNEKANWGYVRLYKLIDKYDVNVVKNNNNTLLLKIGNDFFYYGLIKQKIRLKGTTEWDSKIVQYLKKHFNGNIPLKGSITEKEIILPKIKEPSKEAIEYLEWARTVDTSKFKYVSQVKFVSSVINYKDLSEKQIEILKDIKEKTKINV
jgi:hypothetical protein